MKKILLILTLTLLLASCSQTKNDFKITASADKFEKPQYQIKKGSKLNIVMDAKDLLSIEIKGVGLKLDKNHLNKDVQFDDVGIYDILGNAGNGKIIKSRLTVE
jgi:ABC-type Fe3+-citrate transport system substrate-binding protein